MNGNENMIKPLGTGNIVDMNGNINWKTTFNAGLGI